MNFCEVKRKRARDLTDLDVIRHQGEWREVLAVYRSEDDVYAEMSAAFLDKPFMSDLKALVERAFDRVMDTYVIVRLWLHEKSAGEVEDEFVMLYRHDLVDVQSLPAWEPDRRCDELAEAQKFVRLVAGLDPAAADYEETLHTLRAQAREVIPE